MPSTTRSALAVATLALLVAGCTGTDDPTDTSGDPTETATSPTPSSRPSPSETPTPSETVTVTPTTPAPSRSVEDRLVPAEDLPWFNPEFSWTTGTTASGDPAQVPPCGGFGMLSIGAMDVVHRTYVPEVESEADGLEIIGEFPDVATAKRAYSVLGSDYAKCPRDHDGDPHVGPFTAVALADGAVGGWHLLTYGSTFDAQGFVRRGRYIAQVILTLREAQDYNYEPGQEPMVEALERAAALL